MSDEDEVYDGRTDEQFENALGIQIYATGSIWLDQLPNLVENNPYTDKDVAAELNEKGVVFFRDSAHLEAAIHADDFFGHFISSFHISSAYSPTC